MDGLFERISEDKRDRILKALISEFAVHGFENANTNEIARKADISVGSLYKYFENKEAMFMRTVRYGSDVLKGILEPIMASDSDVFQKIEQVIRTIQQHSRENRDLIRLYNEMSTNSNAKLTAAAISEFESVTAKLYTQLISQAKKEGFIRTIGDPRLFAFFMDNLFVMLQFSYSCDYYSSRFMSYGGEDILNRDEYVIEQMMTFIKAAFS